VINRLQVPFPAVLCWVSTWMGLWSGISVCNQTFKSTQPFIPPGLVHVNQVGLLAYLAGVKAGCVHLCRVQGDRVIPQAMANDTP